MTRLSFPGATTLEAYLRADDSRDEILTLCELQRARLPLAHGWIVDLDDAPGDDEAVLASFVRHALGEGDLVRLRTVRAVRGGSAITATLDGDTWERGLGVFFETLRNRSGAGRLVRVVPLDAKPTGRATSADEERSDPDMLCVWASEKTLPWRIERRSTRVSEKGDGLDIVTVESAADLVDRIQLVLGRPVELEWASQAGRLVLVSTRELLLQGQIADSEGAWRRVSLALDDEGTVVPLAIDTLSKALRTPSDPPRHKSVERLYARPYRRRTGRLSRGNGQPLSLGRAAASAARSTAELAPLIAECKRFESTFFGDVDRTRANLATMTVEELCEHLEEWQSLVGRPLKLLDRTRQHNREVLGALEAAVGWLPRELAVSLSMPKFTSDRRAVHARLAHLGEQVGERDLAELDLETRRLWKRLRHEFRYVRSLGIDLAPVAFGASNQSLALGLADRLDERADAREGKRESATSAVLSMAREHLLGLPRVALAQSIMGLLGHLTRLKGMLADAIAEALLGLRHTALEAGRRLEEEAILDDPEDALYLHAKEIRKALKGTVGSYASRVRVRREDDARWSSFAAPRRL